MFFIMKLQDGRLYYFCKTNSSRKNLFSLQIFSITFFYNFFHCVPYLADARKKKRWNVKFQGIMEICGIFWLANAWIWKITFSYIETLWIQSFWVILEAVVRKSLVKKCSVKCRKIHSKTDCFYHILGHSAAITGNEEGHYSGVG